MSRACLSADSGFLMRLSLWYVRAMGAINPPGRRNLVVRSCVVAGLLAVLPGCASQHDRVPASLAIVHPNTHITLMALHASSGEPVHGHFYLVGGPPGPPRPLGGTVTFSGPVTREVSVGNDGRIVTRLPPGNYLAEGFNPLMGYPCKPDSPVTVEPNHPARVNVYCRVP